MEGILIMSQKEYRVGGGRLIRPPSSHTTVHTAAIQRFVTNSQPGTVARLSGVGS